MCGICGIFNFARNEPVNSEILRRMNQKLVHRGPDGEGYFFTEGKNFSLGLGMRRLAIIDLATGHQPIYNEDKSLAIVFNGEIYNFLELRQDLIQRGHRFYTKSDTETIVHLYEEYGTDCLKHLVGMFAFALWDNHKKQLFLARDRLGKKPLFYLQQEGTFAFASELSALLELPFNFSLNYPALDLFLLYQYIPSPHSVFTEIKKLPPANFLLLREDGKIKTENYWSIDFRQPKKNNRALAEEQFTEIFRTAVKQRLISDVPLGAFLSGGIDSSLVVAQMSELSPGPVKTFTIGFSDRDFSEIEYARTISQLFHTEHQEFIVQPLAIEILPKIVWHYSEPFADPSALPSYYVAQLTRKYVTVALNGDGGDENFGGYLRYLALKISQDIEKFPGLAPILKFLARTSLPAHLTGKKLWNYFQRMAAALQLSAAERNLLWHGFVNKTWRDKIYSAEMKERLSEFPPAENYLLDKFNQAPAQDIVEKSFYADLTGYLPECLLVKMDIATMANSLEARSPFLDHRLVEWAITLPPGWKIHHFTTKYFLRKLLAKKVPAKICRRRKQGFGLPLDNWFRQELSGYIRDILLSPAAVQRGYFNIAEIKNLLAEHQSGQGNHGYKLWALLVLELWHQVFIDKKFKF